MKRFFSLLLVAVLLLSLIPTALADEGLIYTSSQQQTFIDTARSYLGMSMKDFGDIDIEWCIYFVNYCAQHAGLGAYFPPYQPGTWQAYGWASTSASYFVNWVIHSGMSKFYCYKYAETISRYGDRIKPTADLINASPSTFEPIPGDVIIIDHPDEEHPNNDWIYDHGAIVVDYDAYHRIVTYIGGNQGHEDRHFTKVTTATLSLDSGEIAGFMRPNYTTEYVYPVCSRGESCPSAVFEDVRAADWFHLSLDRVIDAGLFKGTSETLFSPNRIMTRGMFVSVLYRLSGSPDVSELTVDFSDIDEETWCLDAVKWAYSNEIVHGFDDGLFRPDELVTRAQAAVILYGYSKFCGFDVSAYKSFDGFVDADTIGEWAQDAMHWAMGTGFIQGRTALTISPASGATRAQVSAILARYLDYYGL